MLCDNHYSHCDESWTLEDCDSFHNDECPKCGSEITPANSTEYTEEGTKEHYHSMNVYEVDLVGFYGGTDLTDDLVLWIKASSEDSLKTLLEPVSALVSSIQLLTDIDGDSTELDGVDLTEGLSTADDVMSRVAGGYSSINDLYIGDYNLKSELAANEIARQCREFVASSDL